jgi:hypothetical protein
MPVLLAPEPTQKESSFSVLSRVPKAGRSQRLMLGVGIALVYIGFPWLMIRLEAPPKPRLSTTPGEFSATRVQDNLHKIANLPHPVGSQSHEAVRTTLVSQLSDLSMEVQSPEVVSTVGNVDPPYVLATVRNIVARLPGTANTKAILLSAHYDSVPTGPGAADNGAAVASILEVVRVLRAGTQLKNDIIVLFTDSEEIGLMGAKAFIHDPQWKNKIGIILNFDAHGSRGPLIMFETSPNSGWAVREAAASHAPVMSSVMSAIYRRLGFGTDFDAFKSAGIAGLNFAFIDGAEVYHTRLDTPEHISAATLQDEGTTTLELLTRLGNMNLDQRESPDISYFNVAGRYAVTYRNTVTLTVALLVLGFVFFDIWKEAHRARSIPSIIIGFIALAVAAATAYLVSGAMLWLVSGGKRIGFLKVLYHRELYSMIYVLIGIASVSLAYALARARFHPSGLASGARIWYVIFLILITLFMPPAAYLFVWPILFSLPAVILLRSLPEHRVPTVLAIGIALVLAANAGFIAPFLRVVFSGVGPGLGRFVLIFLVLFLGLMFPLLELAYRWRPLGIAAIATCIAAVLVGWGVFHSNWTNAQPQPDHLLYAYDGSQNKAVWASMDEQPDNWTQQFLGDSVRRSELTGFLPPVSGTYLSKEAPLIGLEAPEAVLVSSSRIGEQRTVRIQIRPHRGSAKLTLFLNTQNVLTNISVGGEHLPDTGAAANRWGFQYVNPAPEGIEFKATVRAETPLVFTVFESSYGLPQIAHVRPSEFMAANLPGSDITIASKVFSF